MGGKNKRIQVQTALKILANRGKLMLDQGEFTGIDSMYMK